MKDLIEENLKENLISKKKEMKINKFQIENIKINSILIKIKKEDKEENIDLNKNIKFFFELNKNILLENEVIDFGVEIEIIPFGQSKFENESIIFENKELGKKRIFDENGNIFILLKGKIK